MDVTGILNFYLVYQIMIPESTQCLAMSKKLIYGLILDYNEHHDKRLHQVLEIARKNNFKLRKPDERKLETITNMIKRIPTNVILNL